MTSLTSFRFSRLAAVLGLLLLLRPGASEFDKLAGRSKGFEE